LPVLERKKVNNISTSKSLIMKKKTKTYDEYDKDLLDNKPSKRDLRGAAGLELLTDSPGWATPDNRWGDRLQYTENIEVWKKLCIEAYFSGWVDFFDAVIWADKIDHKIYFKWDAGPSGHSILEIYFEPGTKPIPAPPPVNLFMTVPKPPPPIMG